MKQKKACPSQEMVLPMSYDVIDVTSRCGYRARTVRSSGFVRRVRCQTTVVQWLAVMTATTGTTGKQTLWWHWIKVHKMHSLTHVYIACGAVCYVRVNLVANTVSGLRGCRECVGITQEPPEDQSWYCPKHRSRETPKSTGSGRAKSKAKAKGRSKKKSLWLRR